MTALLPPINRARFALIMGVATVCATGLAAGLAASADGATTNTTLIVAGVRFMGETAKILTPEKRVLMPTLEATCSLDLGCPIDASP